MTADETEMCDACNGSGFGVADTYCGKCGGAGGYPMTNKEQAVSDAMERLIENGLSGLVADLRAQAATSREAYWLNGAADVIESIEQTKAASHPLEQQKAVRMRDLELALDLACRTLGDQEPPDSRAVSSEFVAMFSILCDKANDECREIIKAAIAEHEARTALQEVGTLTRPEQHD